MAGPILGPMLGGWLTEDHNRRWVFHIDVPVDLAASLGLHCFVIHRAAGIPGPRGRRLCGGEG